LLYGCGGKDFVRQGESDVAISWQRATAYVPGTFAMTAPPNIPTDKKYPVVLYMHGCSGIGPTDRLWGGFLKDQGFIVVQPNSMARDRPMSCDPGSHRSGLLPGVHGMRLGELDYAREQIARSAWLDRDRVFLMGHSEGGYVVSLSSRSDFRGVIISAWHCGYGINTPEKIPVLAIDHEADPWFPHVDGGGCRYQFGARPRSKQVTLRGKDHDTFEVPAQQAVSAFLKDLLAKP
jgi:poly(3-hydroxybutyrate) depolymerase